MGDWLCRRELRGEDQIYESFELACFQMGYRIGSASLFRPSYPALARRRRETTPVHGRTEGLVRYCRDHYFSAQFVTRTPFCALRKSLAQKPADIASDCFPCRRRAHDCRKVVASGSRLSLERR